jgi:hypothetical protein
MADPIEKAVRQGKLERLMGQVEALVREELGAGARWALVLAEPQQSGAMGVSLLSGEDPDKIGKMLDRAMRAVRADG